MVKRAFAIAAHPDDIEFMMAGTLIRLAGAGYEIHYMNIGNGSCGTAECDAETIIRMRREESMAAAEFIGAVFHESLVNDIEIFYERELLARLGAIVRKVAPEIILTHAPDEYMEDHSNACRLAVSAAFTREMRNFPVIPPRAPTGRDVTVYHAMPYGLRNPLGKLVKPGFSVDITPVIEKKRKMLAMHKSQKEWLDKSQGLDSYLLTMESMCAEMGSMSGGFKYAEGWTRRLHLGLCAEDDDPLQGLLCGKIK